MATVREDIVESAALTWGATTMNVSRIFSVSGLSGTVSARPYEAVTAGGIPTPNTAHPSIPDMIVETVDVAMEGAFDARVTVKYKLAPEAIPPGGGAAGSTFRWQIGGSVSQEERYIVATYQSIQQNVPISVLVPELSLSATRTESSDPRPRAYALIGCINQFAVGSFPADTLLCTNVQANTADNLFWEVTYEFQYKRAKWYPIGYYVGADGNVPSSVSVNPSTLVGNGYTISDDEYPRYDFSTLGL